MQQSVGSGVESPVTDRQMRRLNPTSSILTHRASRFVLGCIILAKVCPEYYLVSIVISLQAV